MRCHVLTPLKPPDHPVPSGDRAIARILIAALRRLGFAPALASRLQTRLRTGGEAELAALQVGAAHDIERLLAAEETLAHDPPAMVFAYHVYYKAPDLIGPELARRLGVPYVVAEGSRSPKQAHGPFAAGHHLAEAALDAAALVLCASRHDRRQLDAHRPPGQAVVDLPPFIDLADWPAPALPPERDGPTRLLTVAMMRHGDKMDSYTQLAAALARLADRPWTLDIVGDGPARAEVEALFAPFGARVHLHGRLEGTEHLAALYAGADLLVWPAVREAFGLVFLEAQSQGLPCIAVGHGGVADAIRDGVTGRVLPPAQAGAFADALAAALSDRATREAWRRAARDFVARERSLDAALPVLSDALGGIGVRVPRP